MSRFKDLNPAITLTVLTRDEDVKNTFANHPQTVLPKMSAYKAGKSFSYSAAPYSLAVVQVRRKGK